MMKPNNMQTALHDQLLALGRDAREAREHVGLSQEDVARLAGVSQGAVSRFEGGRGKSTPLIVVASVCAAVATAGKTNHKPEELPPAAHRIARFAGVFDGKPPKPVVDPKFVRITKIYRALPEPRRHDLLAVVEPLAKSYANGVSPS